MANRPLGKMVEKECKNCGARFTHPNRRPRKMCSQACLVEWRAKNVPENLTHYAKTVRKSQMLEDNPMKDPAVRAKVSTTLRAMGWKPPKQGGNGRGETPAQKLIACALGWEMEVAVKTRMKTDSGYPTCYKLDVGNRDLKIGIEVNGNSHRTIERTDQDVKKKEFLESIGWKVLSFWNEEVMDNLEECVQKVLSTISK